MKAALDAVVAARAGLREVFGGVRDAGAVGKVVLAMDVVDGFLAIAEEELRAVVAPAGASKASAGGPGDLSEFLPVVAVVGPRSTIEAPDCPKCGACTVLAPEDVQRVELQLAGTTVRFEAYDCTKCRFRFGGHAREVRP